MSARTNFLHKLSQSFLPLLLSLVFTMATFYLGAIPLYRYLHQWYLQNHYVALKASLSEVHIVSSPENQRHLLLGRLRYHYLHDQVDLRNQVLLQSESDKGIDYLLEMQRNYQRTDRQTILIDPALPQHWIMPVEPKARNLLFLLPFVIVSGLIALACMQWSRQVWRKASQDEKQIQQALVDTWSQKYVQLPVESELAIRDDRLGFSGVVLFVLCWNGIALPLTYLLIFSEQGNVQMGWGLLSLIFPLVGFLLVIALGRQAFSDWQIGPALLTSARTLSNEMTQFNLRCYLAQPLGKRFFDQHMTYSAQVTLSCKRFQKRDDEQEETTLYQQNLNLPMLAHGSQYLDLVVPIAANLPATQEDSETQRSYVWELKLELAGRSLSFTLPVKQGNQQVDGLNHHVAMLTAELASLPDPRQLRKCLWTVIGLAALVMLFPAWMAYQHSQTGGDAGQSGLTQDATTPITRHAKLAELERLSQQGADLNAFDEDGKTLLMYAADQADLTSLKFLLQHGVTVDLATNYQADIGGRTALFGAIENDALDAVVLLLDAGASMQQRSNRVWTPVHYAAYKGALKSLRELARRGADLQQKFQGGRGSTPLMIAAQYQQVAVINFLLQEAKVDKTMRDDYAEDACGYALYYQKTQSLRALACD